MTDPATGDARRPVRRHRPAAVDSPTPSAPHGAAKPSPPSGRRPTTAIGHRAGRRPAEGDAEGSGAGGNRNRRRRGHAVAATAIGARTVGRTTGTNPVDADEPGRT